MNEAPNGVGPAVSVGIQDNGLDGGLDSGRVWGAAAVTMGCQQSVYVDSAAFQDRPAPKRARLLRGAFALQRTGWAPLSDIQEHRIGPGEAVGTVGQVLRRNLNPVVAGFRHTAVD